MKKNLMKLLLLTLSISATGSCIQAQELLLDIASESLRYAVDTNNVAYFKALNKTHLSTYEVSRLLALAAAHGHVEIGIELLRNGALVNHLDGTALKRAACFNHVPMVKMLLKYGADGNLCDEPFLARLTPEMVKIIKEGTQRVERPSALVLKHMWSLQEGTRRKIAPTLESEVELLLQAHNNSYIDALERVAQNKRKLISLIPRLIEAAAKSGKSHNNRSGVTLSPLTNELSWRSLNAAIKYDNLECAKALLDCGILPDAQETGDDLSTPFLYAIKMNRADFVELFLTHPRTQDIRAKLLSQRNRLGETPLILACSKEHRQLVDDVFYHVPEQAHSQKVLDAQLTIVAQLLACGAEVNDVDNNGYTAFTHAVSSLHENLAKLMLNHPRCKKNDKSIIVNFSNAKGRTPILNVAIEGNREALCFLLENGAEVSELPLAHQLVNAQGGLFGNIYSHQPVRDVDGNTAYLLAAAHGHIKIMNALYDKREKLHILPTSETNSKQQNGLHLACLHGHVAAAESFITHQSGYDKNDSYYWYDWSERNDSEGHDALKLAAKAGHANIISFLLGMVERKNHRELKNIVNNKRFHWWNDDKREAALHLAAKQGHISVVEVLCSYDANKFLRNHKNLTAFQVAIGLTDRKNLRISKIEAQRNSNDVAKFLAPRNTGELIKELCEQGDEVVIKAGALAGLRGSIHSIKESDEKLMVLVLGQPKLLELTLDEVHLKGLFEVGDQVEIKYGPFAGYKGTIQAIREPDDKLMVVVLVQDQPKLLELTVDDVKR